ncbi:MAG: glycosyltransferase family 2 protein [Anaerolineae bacterium]|nr:glycosyltransferase family 2 protein [Anaerolineae bacterium]MCI0609175.1 glycosyltransferase family 2 protein [Anaerolineae bacterium]
MPLITLFSAPKPFTDPHIAMIQRNAIKSWTLLSDVEVILLGEETGLAEAARELDVKHIPNVTRNTNGTPLISSMLQLARQHSNSNLLCIINADMILMPDFVEATRRSRLSRSIPARGQRDKFVLLSQRWDLDITAPLDFVEGWQRQLESTVRTQGQLHRPAGSDFFLFPKSCYHNIPDFAIGRAGWDNWMIYKARKEKWPVIDCTPSVMIVHQNHDYSHLPGGKPHYEHPDTNENIRLAGGQAAVRYTILDSTHQLTEGSKIVRPKMSYLRFMRKVELFLRAIFFFLPDDMIENVVRPKRWKKRIQKIFTNRKSKIINRKL